MDAFKFSGINLALTTRLTAQGRVDQERLAPLIEGYLAAGIRRFVPSSGTGMHVHLSPQQSMGPVAQAAKVIKGRAGFIVQASLRWRTWRAGRE